jgi:hypothetical protein
MTISISSPASFRVMAGIRRGGVIELNWGWKEVEERDGRGDSSPETKSGEIE